MTKLTNAQLVDLGREHIDAKAAESAAKARKQAASAAIVAELNRRGKSTLEVDGVRFVKKAPTVTTYSVERLKATLKRRAGRFLRVDGKALAAAVRAGEISEADKAACVETTDCGSAYADVTELVG